MADRPADLPRATYDECASSHESKFIAGQSGQSQLHLQLIGAAFWREAAALPRAFIQTTQSDLYNGLMVRAREAGWYCRELSGGHYAMFTQPEAVASALNELPP